MSILWIHQEYQFSLFQRWKDNPADPTAPKLPHAYLLHFTNVQGLLEMAKKDVMHSNDHFPNQTIVKRDHSLRM